MRILYLHQHFCPPDGMGNNRSLELANYWTAAGHSVTIVCGSGNFKEKLPFYSLCQYTEISGIHVIRLNVGYSHFYPFTKRILSFLCYLILTILLSYRLRKTDLVYASSTPLTVGILGLWFKKVFGKPFVFETVDLWPDVPIQMGVLKNKWLVSRLFALEKSIYRQSAAVVCLSEGMKERIEEKGISSHKMIVAHNGTNCVTFRPPNNKAKAKRALGFAETDFVVLYSGTIGEANELEFLIDVASEMKNTSVKFIFLGNGNRKKQVLEYAHAKQVGNVSFFDSVPKKEVSTYFDAADVGAVIFAPFPILETNSANKFFDYLAAGLPVLINYGGWQSSYLADYKCGFSTKESQEMAQKIELLAQDEMMCNEMGTRARKLAEETFDRKLMAQQILQKMEPLLSSE